MEDDYFVEYHKTTTLQAYQKLLKDLHICSHIAVLKKDLKRKKKFVQ